MPCCYGCKKDLPELHFQQCDLRRQKVNLGLGRNRGIACRKCKHIWKKKERRNRIQIVTNAWGGKCSVCDYSKCIAALEFHHVDPKLKTREVWQHLRALKPQSAVNLLYEEKCVLLCSNCHREVEYEKLDVTYLLLDKCPIIDDKELPISQRSVTKSGRTMLVPQWLTEIDLSSQCFYRRLHRGMSLTEAATSPKRG